MMPAMKKKSVAPAAYDEPDEDWNDDDDDEEEGEAPRNAFGGDAYGATEVRRLTIEELDVDDEEDEGFCRIFAKGVYKAFMPYQRFMHILGRYPCGSEEKNGHGTFFFKMSKPYAIGFCFMTIITLIVTLLVVLNTIGILLDSPKITKTVGKRGPKTLRLEEWYLFRRNIVPVIIVVTSLIHASIGNINFILKRHFACTYLSFWTEAAEITRIDVASGLYDEMWWMMCLYGGFLVLFGGLCAVQFAPVSTGAPAILTMLTFRVFVPHIHAVDWFWVLRTIEAVLFLYVMISAKAYVFYFIFYAKLLKNGFVIWNHRLDRVLHRGEGSLTRAEKIANRTGYDHLFKDHVCLLDLLSGLDTLSANTIESYYATQIFSVCFEVYYFYRSQAATHEFTGVRRLDGVIIFIYIVNTFWVFFMCSNAAAEVAEEAMDGLEIVRRKGMLGRKTDEELYFVRKLMLSMYVSYTGHFETAISGGRYFTLDKSFLVGIVGTIFSYFIILMQFTPPLTLTSPYNLGSEIDSALLLRTAEGTRNFGFPRENITKALINL